MALRDPNFAGIVEPVVRAFREFRKILEVKFDELKIKFDSVTGHKHTGVAGDGPKIPILSLDTDIATQAELDAKFNATTGHKHSGASGDAPPIYAYESDWISITTRQNYTITHNLNSIPRFIEVLAKASDGTIAKCRYWDYDAEGKGVLITNITITSLTLRTGATLVAVDDAAWGTGATSKTAAYIKVFCFK